MRAIVFLNGSLVQNSAGSRAAVEGAWDLVVCADGGGKHALRLGITPDILLGDFDSLRSDERSALAPRQIQTYPSAKDKTDGQIAVEEALRLGADHIVLAGALGGRFDHTLANIGLLRLISHRGRYGVATDGEQCVYFVNDRLALRGRRNQTVSVLPFTSEAHGVTLSGLRWPLVDATLTTGDSRTISNQFLDEEALFTVSQGELLVITSLYPDEGI